MCLMPILQTAGSMQGEAGQVWQGLLTESVARPAQKRKRSRSALRAYMLDCCGVRWARLADMLTWSQSCRHLIQAQRAQQGRARNRAEHLKIMLGKARGHLFPECLMLLL